MFTLFRSQGSLLCCQYRTLFGLGQGGFAAEAKLGMGPSQTTRGPLVLLHVYIYQGKPGLGT